MKQNICVIIPAFNEGDSIAKVINEIPKMVDAIIVSDNNSTDNTAKEASKAGAIVVSETRKGYGYACLRALEYVSEKLPETDVIVFLDGDYSDYPEELIKIVEPILTENIDFVIGSRTAKLREKHAMTPQQIFGNWLACFLMNLFFGAKFTDLGPFRAIKYEKLLALKMEDKTYGWTVEMQLKAIKQKLTYTEIPVRYRKRIGHSKVSGTVRGTIGAGIKIIGWILKYAFK